MKTLIATGLICANILRATVITAGAFVNEGINQNWQNQGTEHGITTYSRIKKYDTIQNDVVNITANGQEEFIYTTRIQNQTTWTDIFQSYYLLIHVKENINTIDSIMHRFQNQFINSIGNYTSTITYYACDTNQLVENEIDNLENFLVTTGYEENTNTLDSYVKNVGYEIRTITDDLTSLETTVNIPMIQYTDYYVSINVGLHWSIPNESITQPNTLLANIYSGIITETIWNAEATDEGAIDIPGLLFEILGMPFAFISQAFNFTLFPGTNYSLNISHLALGLIVAGILIFVIKKVYK